MHAPSPGLSSKGELELVTGRRGIRNRQQRDGAQEAERKTPGDRDAATGLRDALRVFENLIRGGEENDRAVLAIETVLSGCRPSPIKTAATSSAYVFLPIDE